MNRSMTRARAAFRGSSILCVLALISTGPLALAKDRPLPAEDLATVAAYEEWAEFLRQHDQVARASEAKAHADTLLQASRTTTSEMIGFDPYRELQAYAGALAAEGDREKARSIRAVAQTYREEQVLRLTMHGGKLLDPARYIGRPSDYERKRPGMDEFRYALHGPPGVSANQPPGEDWAMISSKPFVFSKQPASLADRSASGESLLAVLTWWGPAFALNVTADDFPQALEGQLRKRSEQMSHRLVSVAVRHRGLAGEYCADYDLAMEGASRRFPGVLFEISQHGFVCVDASQRFVVEAYYDEWRRQGTPAMVSEEYRMEAEAFLRSVTMSPRRPPTADAPASPEPRD